MKGICNLCKEEKELQRVCHVIPEFFYRDSNLFHGNHNLVKLDLRAFLENNEKKIISFKQKTGEFDQYKFCKECDSQILGAYETYAHDFFYAKEFPKGKELILSDNRGYVECSNTDYKKLKLFFLSILWRSNLSDRPIFSEIELNEFNEEEIREMILKGEPKNDTEFPIFFMNTYFDNTITKDYLFQPIRIRLADENGFIFAFAGMIIFFTIGIKGISNSLLKYRIQKSGVFRMYKVPPGKTWKLINNLYKIKDTYCQHERSNNNKLKTMDFLLKIKNWQLLLITLLLPWINAIGLRIIFDFNSYGSDVFMGIFTLTYYLIFIGWNYKVIKTFNQDENILTVNQIKRLDWLL